jgi:hypothetical protein
MEIASNPGAFLLETAAVGQKLSIAISYFTSSAARLRDLASHIAVSTALLAEAGNQANAHPFFSPHFQTKFEPTILKCKKNYEIILAAVEKANAHKGGDMVDYGRGDILISVPKKPWQKFLWAMGMNANEFKDFENAFMDSLAGVRMVQVVVQLVVLQVVAKEYDSCSAISLG